MSQVEHEYNPWGTEPPDPESDGYIAYNWERRFFHAFLMEYGTVGKAAVSAGVTKDDVEKRLKDNPTFAARMEEIRDYLKDMVRQEVFRRAVEPVEIPIYQRGVLVGKRLEYDSVMLRWVAERLLPEEFNLATKLESGNGDGSIDFHLQIGKPKEEEIDEG